MGPGAPAASAPSKGARSWDRRAASLHLRAVALPPGASKSRDASSDRALWAHGCHHIAARYRARNFQTDLEMPASTSSSSDSLPGLRSVRLAHQGCEQTLPRATGGSGDATDRFHRFRMYYRSTSFLFQTHGSHQLLSGIPSISQDAVVRKKGGIP